ncbi:phage tail tube protein [Rhizobium rhizoryzae]|uniref:Uncharacterized protein n=1 Tax=Rhizobium rhizoryzae TaxID=451876 RepID=A0A7W6PUM4_9HYPH|nr:phage tail tube protein [Rhizobium rhizoryzae]MBB4146025.1 hypothetical protein [Rhizobium rhizoryzae]
MAYQSGRDIAVAFKQEVAFGEKPATNGATFFRINSGGLSLTKGTIQSGENRRDGQTTRARHGAKSVSGQYVADMSLGSFDALIEAAFRGTFAPALVIDEATGGLTSITTTANSIVASAGSFLAAGVRVGDVVIPTNFQDAGNNGRLIRVTGVTASTLTVAETLIANATPDTDFTLTRPKKLIQGKVARSFTVEETEEDVDVSELFKGVRIGRLQIQLQPNGMIVLTFGAVGQDAEVLEGAAAPYFINPAETATIGLTAVECGIRFGGGDVIDLTALTLDLNLNASGVEVIGSTVTPEVFTNNAAITGSVTMLKKDALLQKAFLAEDQLSLHLTAVSPDGDTDFVSFYLGNFSLGSFSKSDIGADNGRTQSFELLIGKDERGGAFDPTMIKFQTSAA